MRGLFADCRHAVRLYARTPGASAIAIAVLAVAMAFVGAFLSLWVDLVLRPQPGFEDGGRIATVLQTDTPYPWGIRFELVERLAEEMGSTEAAAADFPLTVLVGPESEQANIELVSAQFFPGLHPRLALGRGFLPEEHTRDAAPVVVISYRYWQTHFGGDTAVLGMTLELTRDPEVFYVPASTFPFPPSTTPSVETEPEPDRDTAEFRIVGVMGRSLPGAAQAETALWLPMEFAFDYFASDDSHLPTTLPRVYVRRAPGVSPEAVVAEINSRFADEDLLRNSTPGVRLDAIEGIVSNVDVKRNAQRQLGMFLVGSLLLALVAAVNVSLFLLSRATGRRRELGIRQAVGAPIGRLARQLATEAGLLVVVSTLIGLILCVWLSWFLRGLALLRDAEWQQVTLLDWRVLGLAGIVLLALTLLVSLVPVVGIRRHGIAAASRAGRARASLAQRLAATAQIAVAGTFAAAALALAWHLGTLVLSDPGYAVNERQLVRFADARRIGLREGQAGFFVELARWREAIEAIPGVSAVAFGEPVPGDLDEFDTPRGVPDPLDATRSIAVLQGHLDSRFLDVLELRLLHGRAPADGEKAAVVNESFARAIFGRADVVGEPLPPGISGRGEAIVGVIADVPLGHPAATVQSFVLDAGSNNFGETAVVRTTLTMTALFRELERARVSGAIEIEASEIVPLRDLRNLLLAPDRARSYLIIATSGLVMLLSAFGFYGTQQYLVAAGRREYAIRAAIGAGAASIGRLVLRRALALALPGIVLGGLLAFIAVGWLRGDYVSQEISSVAVSLAAIGGLILILLAASLGPARQARRTEPAALLRED